VKSLPGAYLAFQGGDGYIFAAIRDRTLHVLSL
jgi:hypothetical protein